MSGGRYSAENNNRWTVCSKPHNGFPEFGHTLSKDTKKKKQQANRMLEKVISRVFQKGTKGIPSGIQHRKKQSPNNVPPNALSGQYLNSGPKDSAPNLLSPTVPKPNIFTRDGPTVGALNAESPERTFSKI